MSEFLFANTDPMLLHSVYFPPVEEEAKEPSADESNINTKQAAEAEAIASKLPDVPKSEPKTALESGSGDGQPPEKKQKHEE